MESRIIMSLMELKRRTALLCIHDLNVPERSIRAFYCPTLRHFDGRVRYVLQTQPWRCYSIQRHVLVMSAVGQNEARQKRHFKEG